ncbi:hypothetical protein L6164_015768 [Bauhinia variegata]|uniref:Uncharacterized protein n=1 Tax=Bauhinia variegata TaxID=167791 RepID=A0ACB9NNK9_BAUVA|nr:hypothetical protein L6164_015768 [Bauhinia variegata]
MDSPETSKNNVTTTASTTTAATSSSESPPVQESPFFRFVNNLSPIKSAKASHLAQGFLGLSSPPLVFTSPRINSQSEAQFLKRPQFSQSHCVETSQGNNKSESFIDDPDISNKSASLLPGNVITDTQKDLVIKNDENTQHCSSSPRVDEYLVDPVDVDCMYTTHSVNPDVKQFNDAVESSQEESKDVDEPENIEDEITDVGGLSKECAKSERQQCRNSFSQDLQEYEDCGEMGPNSSICAENMKQDGSEACLKPRGMRRRCLQFEEAASNAFGNIKSSSLPLNTPEESRTSSRSSELRDLIAYGSKPSGIGLHLNSIVNAMPLAEGCMQKMKSVSSVSWQKVENMNKCLISSNMDGQSSVGAEDERREITATSESPSTMDPSNYLDHVEHPADVHYKRKLNPKEAGNFEEMSQSSPKRKKKKISATGEDDGCKRCNCKKSKCLKLYCDCFAAGIYCAETCSCQGCYNRPEYEDTVFETRQQIESRNPLAFAPKIVQRATDFPLNEMEDVHLTTPSSARHKRGCNCKRSLCLKKYCECYQANVGCSSACRCEGCKNAYGKKEDYIAIEHAFSKERLSGRVEKVSDGTFHNELEMVANNTDLLRGDLFDLHQLSPLTPSLQCSDQGKEAAKSRVLTGNYHPSSGSDVTVFTPHAKFAECPENPERSLVLQETNEMVGTDSGHWQLDSDNVEIMDQSSPRCTSVSNAGRFASMSNAPSRTMDASIPSKTREWTHHPQAQQSHGSSNILSGGSLRWRSSPITPMTRLGEIKNLECNESESRLFDILEDETPEVLKEASTPRESVKASSPNQKRVSPPKSLARELGSSSSVGLRSGRKFILKAVPSFPPLTPCIDSKGPSHENSGASNSKYSKQAPR